MNLKQKRGNLKHPTGKTCVLRSRDSTDVLEAIGDTHSVSL